MWILEIGNSELITGFLELILCNFKDTCYVFSAEHGLLQDNDLVVTLFHHFNSNHQNWSLWLYKCVRTHYSLNFSLDIYCSFHWINCWWLILDFLLTAKVIECFMWAKSAYFVISKIFKYFEFRKKPFSKQNQRKKYFFLSKGKWYYQLHIFQIPATIFFTIFKKSSRKRENDSS